MEIRTLFVCTFMGARSCIAAELLRRRVGPDHKVAASGFEAGRIGELMRRTAQIKYDICLPVASPPTVFDRYRAGERFDNVITLCGEGTREQCSLLQACVDEMYGGSANMSAWSIRDFSSVKGSEDEIVAEWQRIIADIERHCREYAIQGRSLAV